MSRLQLTLHMLGALSRGLLNGRIAPGGAWAALRRQAIVSHVFKNARPAQVGGRLIFDPFAPAVPSPYFDKAAQNIAKKGFPYNPTYAHIAVTNICPCRCFHCHVQNTQKGDLPKEKVLELIDSLVRNDFPMLLFVGGEPFSRFDDLVSFVKAASPHMDTRMFTSGVGGSRQRLQALREAGLVGVYVSVDSADEATHNQKRGHPNAFAAACQTIRDAVDLGFYVSVVCCTTSDMAQDSSYLPVVELAEKLGAHSIQLNEIRPVGDAQNSSNGAGIYLTDADRARLITYYKAKNASGKGIAIALPWYLEEPYNLGCSATAAQKAYIDAHGNVQACELLKASFGNITERSFDDIWADIRKRCQYPVDRCIVWDYNMVMQPDEPQPLSPARTMATWDPMTKLPPAVPFSKEVCGCQRPPAPSLAYFAAQYSLDLRRGTDYQVAAEHWLNRLTGAGYIALGSTLYTKAPVTDVPDHEFLHLAQFHQYGAARVLGHYVFHIAAGLAKGLKPGEAFARIPFEVEARAYADLKSPKKAS